MMFGVWKRRNYGLDMLKLISMFIIVFVIIMDVSGLYLVRDISFSGELTNSIYILFLYAVSAFALISGYVNLTNYRYANIISLCIRAVFYCGLITVAYIVLALINGWQLGFVSVVTSLVPALVGEYWYFSAYFCLFFFMPVLNSIIDLVPRHVLRNSGFFIFVILCCCSRVVMRDALSLNAGFSFIWICLLYLIGAYLAKYKPFENSSKRANLLVFLGMFAITVLAHFLTAVITKGIFEEIRYADMLVSMTSPTILLGSVALLNLFSKLTPYKAIDVIRVITPAVFSTYLVACHPAFVKVFFPKLMINIYVDNVYLMICLSLAVATGIFIAVILVDFLRVKLFQILNVDKIVRFAEKVLKKIKRKIFKILRMKDNGRWY